MSAHGHQSTLPHSPELEVKLSAIFASIPEPLVLVNAENRIALANPQAEELFGQPRDALLGKVIETLLPPRLRNSHARDHFPPAPAGATGKFSGLFGLHHDGREFPIEIHCRPLQTGEGTWTLHLIHDLTQQKSLQKELNEKTAALETARQEFQSFSHSISHDLRAPLRAMDGFAAALKRSLGENLPQESNHAIHRIQENVSRMSKLIDGLLDYSALSWLALTPRKIQPAAIAQKSFEAISTTFTNRHVDFSVNDLPACEADTALLRRLFDNLISNALKFTRERNPAVIRVGSRDQDGETIFFVQDNGVGFDMEYSGKLFHVFQRLHSPSDFEGTGMGLAIVHRIAQRHGGRVWADGKVDHGATFYFTLGKSGYGNSA